MRDVLIEKELGAFPSTVEMEVVDILVLNKIPKKSVKFLKPNRTKGASTPDLLIDGVDRWEIKSIEKLGKYTIEHAARAGIKQADNLIFDLRKLIVALEKKATSQVKRQFTMTKEWRGLVIIIRPGDEVLTFKK